MNTYLCNTRMLALSTFILTNIETDKHFQTFHAQFHCDILKIWIALVFLYSIKKKDIYFKIIKKKHKKETRRYNLLNTD